MRPFWASLIGGVVGGVGATAAIIVGFYCAGMIFEDTAIRIIFDTRFTDWAGWAGVFLAVATVFHLRTQTTYLGSSQKEVKKQELINKLGAAKKLRYRCGSIVLLHEFVMKFINPQEGFNQRKLEAFYFHYSNAYESISHDANFEIHLSQSTNKLYAEFDKQCSEYIKPYLRVFGVPNKDVLLSYFDTSGKLSTEGRETITKNFFPEFWTTNFEPIVGSPMKTRYELVKKALMDLEESLDADIAVFFDEIAA